MRVRVPRSPIHTNNKATRREAARQYRRALEGEIKIEDMSRLVNALAILSRMIESGEFEGRLP